MISKRAKTYGQALFEVESSELLLESLKVLEQVLKEQVLYDFFNSFVIPLKNKKEELKKVLKDHGHLQNFLFLLLDKKALSLLPEITQAYEQLLNEKLLRSQGVIYSSEDLSEPNKKQIEDRLSQFLKKKISLISKVDAHLIGGFRVKLKDYVFNDTLEFHLNKFQVSGG